ncbi:MAG: type II secretion system F family protein [Treponema sp.]|nr:type II secretion system F family protein [Treponema sp.]
MTNETAVRVFTESLYELISENLSLYKVLKILSESKITSYKIRKTCQELAEEVSCGTCFSNALAKNKNISFDKTYISFIAFSEENVDLKSILLFLLERCRRKTENFRQISAAMIYPLFVIFLLLSALIIFFIFGNKIFAGYDFSFLFEKKIFKKILLSLLPSVFVTFLFFKEFYKKSSDNKLYEAFLASGFLVKEGINVASSVGMASLVVENSREGKMFEEAKYALEKGMDLRTAFLGNRKIKGIYSSIEMSLYLAEETGNKELVFLKIAEMLNRKNERERKIFLSLVEPVLIGSTGLIFLSVVIQFVLPFFTGMGL